MESISPTQESFLKYTITRIPELVYNKPLELYTGVVYNHAVKNDLQGKYGNPGKENKAWYAGASWGIEPQQEGEWNLECRYEHVGANSIRSYDLGGTQVGPKTDVKEDNKPNYRGIRLKGIYAFTDNLFFNIEGILAKEAKRQVNGNIRYREAKLKIEYKF